MGIHDGEITDSEDDGALTESDSAPHSPVPSKPATFCQPNEPAIPLRPSTEPEPENPIPASAELRRAQIAADTAAILTNTDSSSASFPPTLPLPTKPTPPAETPRDIYAFNASSEDSDSIAVIPAPSVKKKRTLTAPAARNRRHDDGSDDDWGAAATKSAAGKKRQPKKRTRTLPATITSLISSEDELAAPAASTTITSTRKKRERREVNYYIPPPPGSTPSPQQKQPSSAELPEPTPAQHQKNSGDSLLPTPARRPNPNIIIDLSHPDLILATQEKREYIPADTSPRFQGTLESLGSTVPDGSMREVEVPPVPKELLEKSFVEPGYEDPALGIGSTGSTGSARRSVTDSVTGSGGKQEKEGARRSKTEVDPGIGWEAGRVASEWRAAKGKKNYREVLPEDDEDEWTVPDDDAEIGRKGKKGTKKGEKKTEKKAPAKKRKKTGEGSSEQSTGGTTGAPGSGAADSHSEAAPQPSTGSFSVPPPSSPLPNIKINMPDKADPSTAQPHPASPTIRFKEPEQPSLRVKLNVGRRAATAFAHLGSGSEKGSSPQRRYKRTKSRFPDGDELSFESELSDVPTSRKKPRAAPEDDEAQAASPAAKKQKPDPVLEQPDEPALDLPMTGKSRKKSKAAQEEEEDWGAAAKPKKTPARTKSKAPSTTAKSRKKSNAPAQEPTPQPDTAPEQPAPTEHNPSRAHSDDSASLTPPPASPPPSEDPPAKRKRTKSAKQMPPPKSKRAKPPPPEPEQQPDNAEGEVAPGSEAEKKPQPEPAREVTPATPAPVDEKKEEQGGDGSETPKGKGTAPRPAHSPIRANNKVPFRVGLSRRHRIAPLLKVVKKKP